MEGLDCSNPVNQQQFVGNFEITREPNIVFMSEGSLGAPVALAGVPYDSKSVLPSGQRHLVDMGMMNSYYSIPVDVNSLYVVSVDQPSDDVALYVYSDASFTTQLCYADFNVGALEEQCGVFTDGVTSTLYIQVYYLGGMSGASYDMRVERNKVSMSLDDGVTVDTHIETTQTGIATDIFIGAMYNETAVGGGRTEIRLAKNYNTGTFDFDDQFLLTVNVQDMTGTYMLNTDVDANYSIPGTNYINDGVYASGSVTLDKYDQVIRGSYDVTLCIEGLDCSVPANQQRFLGDFEVAREPNLMFMSEGDSGTPFALPSAPYDSTVTQPVGMRHLVDFGIGSSYYSVPVSASTAYTVTLSAPSEDVNLYVYTSADFITTAFCSSDINAGAIDESCNATTGAGDSMLYIRVDYAGGLSGASFDLLVN